MGSIIDTAGMLAVLREGGTALLPSARAAKQMRDSFDQRQASERSLTWEPPPIFAWSEWLESVWSRLTLEGDEERVLLNPLQEERLWERVIAASSAGEKLPPPSLRSLAALASSAFALACAHASLSLIQRTADSPDAQAFAGWQEAFQAECAAERLLPRSLLLVAIASHLRTGKLAPPGPLHLAGFEELTPAQLSLLEALRRAGSQVGTYSLERGDSLTMTGLTVELPSPDEELRWAALWLRERFETRSGGPLRLAVILPDLTEDRAALESVFREVLAPELEPVGIDLSSTPWHFTAGPALDTVPLVRHALSLLRWLDEPLSPDEIGSILLSPYFGFRERFEQLARFEAKAVRGGTRTRPELTFSEFLHLGSASGLPLPELQAVLQLAGDPAQRSGTALHAEWADLVRKLLRTAGWPGTRTLTPAEFRATEAWDGVLDLLATLDVLGERIGFPEWRSRLVAQMTASPAPDALAGAAVEVLRLEETQGCCFDAALLLHATDGNLPSAIHPHPLLGWEFHRLLHLPEVDASTAFLRGRNLLSGLGKRCGELVLLHARAEAHGPLRLTALAAELSLRAVQARELLPMPPEPARIELCEVEEPDRLPLRSLAVGGGARLLELQAACGFRAFATLRLGASTPEQISLGLGARDRGKLLHKALEVFWKELRSQAALRSLTGAAQQDAIARAVTAAFSSLHLDPGASSWQAAYLAVCQGRLQTLLTSWLTHELERSDFEVLTQEQDRFVQVGPFTLKVRPDRVDRVEGGFVFVDYKSSADLSTEHWLGDRPQAPQLPLYTLLHAAEDVRALAFARLRPGSAMRWIGLQQEEGDLRRGSGIKLHDLPAQVAAWREELDRLAEDFAAGVITVDPKTYPKTCNFCEHKLLCRLDAETLLAQSGSAGGQEGSAEVRLG